MCGCVSGRFRTSASGIAADVIFRKILKKGVFFSIIKHIGKSIERFERGMAAMFMYSCVCDRQMGNVGSFHVQSLIEKSEPITL